MSAGRPIIYLNRYRSVADERYIPSDRFGALIDDTAILEAMQEVRGHRGTSEGGFHVHVHEHRGQPGFSEPDVESLPAIIPGISRMDPTGASGILLLSKDHAIALVWLPGEKHHQIAKTVSVIGAPMSICGFKEFSLDGR
jgi:hypothetical protein